MATVYREGAEFGGISGYCPHKEHRSVRTALKCMALRNVFSPMGLRASDDGGETWRRLDEREWFARDVRCGGTP